MHTRYTVWRSTDRHYYAIEAPESPTPPAYDVLEVDGPGIWLARRYWVQGWNDPDVRYRYAEFPGIIASWTNLGRWTRGRTRYIAAFRTSFVDIRQDVQVLPFASRSETNPILARYAATFLRRQPIHAALWDTLQQRIARGIADGTDTLLALHAQPGTCEEAP